MASRCGIDDQRGDLLSELTTGFEALLGKVEDLAVRNAEFRKQIKDFQAENHAQFTPTKGSFTSSEAPDAEKAIKDEDLEDLEGDPKIAKGIQAWELLRMSMTGTVPLRRKRWRRLSPNRTLVGPKPDLERDFTTQGTQGQLKCPFSKTLPDIEEHLSQPVPQLNPLPPRTPPKSRTGLTPEQALTSSQSGCARSKSISNNGSVPQCPIRFLNQIPAEEVAKYFEEHKHEIPRSHEVCVKRYQANEQSIRSLDAKYGNLVNMIRGLGQKHQPMLPTQSELEAEDEAVELDEKSIEKVEKWAEHCADSPAPDIEAVDADDKDEERTSHFERPLKEIRLGESPSRPWGIQVPYHVSEKLAVSSDAPEAQSVAAPVQPSTQKDSLPEEPTKHQPAGRCPFGHGAAQATRRPESPSVVREEPKVAPEANPSISSGRLREVPTSLDEALKDRKGSGQIVFTGPVFFGYSAEDAAALMRSLQGM